MKKILITGENSYIGTSFEKWISKYPDRYSVNTICLKNNGWKKKSFKDYDVLLHTAAIVHKKDSNTSAYFKVNKDLTVEVATKAKKEGVKQFIFLSTMGVYGTEIGYITENTVPSPKTPYAQSKYEAEQELIKLITDDYKVAILRPPIVYGKGCKGNYPKLVKLALKLPFFPSIDNRRSMIYIDNLVEFIRIIIEHDVNGIFHPQNEDYVNTTQLVKLIVHAHNKKVKEIKVNNFLNTIGYKVSSSYRKVFGSFVYDKSMLGCPGTIINGERIDYKTASFEETVKNTESTSI